MDNYTNTQGNEDSINLLEPGVTVLNRRSVKGQEFDTVFILQLESFISMSYGSNETYDVHAVR